MFLYTHGIDVMLTEKSYIRIPQYTFYHTNHPAGTARCGTAIILKSSIQHHQLNPYSQAFLQATSGAVEGTTGLLTISAVYLPPKRTIHQEQLEEYYYTLGHRLAPIWTYKIQLWGSASICNTEILEHFQGKVLRMITVAPWYVPNMLL
jgi:hypothetical protein